MILSVTLISFTHTIYTLVTHKCKRGHLERKTLDRFSTTHTHPSFRESYSSLSENSFVVSSLSFSHCYTLRRDLYPNTTHTYSECRECFGAWEALGICQKKPMRLGRCNRAYCGIWKARQNTVPRSLVGVGAWRA